MGIISIYIGFGCFGVCGGGYIIRCVSFFWSMVGLEIFLFRSCWIIFFLVVVGNKL